MGMQDKINEMKDKAKDAVSGHATKENVDKASGKAKEKMGGQHSDEIDKGANAVKDRMDK